MRRYTVSVTTLGNWQRHGITRICCVCNNGFKLKDKVCIDFTPEGKNWYHKQCVPKNILNVSVPRKFSQAEIDETELLSNMYLLRSIGDDLNNKDKRHEHTNLRKRLFKNGLVTKDRKMRGIRYLYTEKAEKILQDIKSISI